MSAPSPLPNAAKSKVHRNIAGLGLLLFFTSLAMPAMRLDNGEVWPGSQVLMSGWLGPFIGQFGWYANPFFVTAVVFIFLRRAGWAAAFTVLALVFAVTSGMILNAVIPLDEANVRKAKMIGFGPGFYVWFTALATPLLGLFFRPTAPRAGN